MYNFLNRQHIIDSYSKIGILSTNIILYYNMVLFEDVMVIIYIFNPKKNIVIICSQKSIIVFAILKY